VSAAASPGRVDAPVSGLRSQKGQILACIMTQTEKFPDCKAVIPARQLTMPVSATPTISFVGLPEGDYAIAMIHDENGNGKLDTMMGMPREGFGFSRNPAIRMGPPTFASAMFHIGSGTVSEPIKVKYML